MSSTAAAWVDELIAADFPFNTKDGFKRIPTLEEVIEACGEVFHSLTLIRGNDYGAEEWQALRGGHITLQEHYKGEGSTPTEAVARLWLALNKKSEATSGYSRGD